MCDGIDALPTHETRVGRDRSLVIRGTRSPALPEKQRLTVLSSVLTAVALLHLVLGGAALAGVFSGRPDVLVCSVSDPIDVQPWDKFVFYVSARLEDGSVLYKSLTSNPVLVSVTTDGLVQADNLEDCDGKSVAELRDEGRAFDFPAAALR